jgi:hypothetical protein
MLDYELVQIVSARVHLEDYERTVMSLVIHYHLHISIPYSMKAQGLFTLATLYCLFVPQECVTTLTRSKQRAIIP